MKTIIKNILSFIKFLFGSKKTKQRGVVINKATHERNEYFRSKFMKAIKGKTNTRKKTAGRIVQEIGISDRRSKYVRHKAV